MRDTSDPHGSQCEVMDGMQRSGSYEKIYAVVRRIPHGRVATYGQVAELAGLGGHARQVGYALHALRPGSRVPWQRVVNAQGRVSARSEFGTEQLQRTLLEQEGVCFGLNQRIDLLAHGWQPRPVGRRRRDEARREQAR